MSDPTADAIRRYYAEVDEDARLTGGFGTLEKVRTQEIIGRYLGSTPLTIYDVGGGTGVYAFWLAELGHTVSLIDIVPKHVEIVQRRVREHSAQIEMTASVGDARALDVDDSVADLVLLHGPLYHLTELDDRIKALSEAARILRPGGRVLAFCINRYAGLNYAIRSGRLWEDSYYRMVEAEVTTGNRLNTGVAVRTFRHAYFHTLDDIRQEVEVAGLEYETTLGTTGTAWMVDDVDAAVLDPARMSRLLEAARLMESTPTLSPTMCSVARAR